MEGDVNLTLGLACKSPSGSNMHYERRRMKKKKKNKVFSLCELIIMSRSKRSVPNYSSLAAAPSLSINKGQLKSWWEKKKNLASCWEAVGC